MKNIVMLFLIGISFSAFGFFGQKGIFKNIDVKEFEELIKDKEVIILDIRTPGELNGGYVEGAINIDYYSNDFANKLDALDKDKKYVIYCRSGNRSGHALSLMKKLKFKEVYNLKGGVGALQRAGFPLIMPVK